MITLELFQNLAIGIIGGIIASILTLIGDRWRHRNAIERRLHSIAGDYSITANTPQRDTREERVEIRLVAGRRFSITSTGGPTGNWGGHFIVHEDSLDVAHGVYRYPGSTDWGQHELLFDRSTESIFIYGVNRSQPGLWEPFSLILSRQASRESKLAYNKPVESDAPQADSPKQSSHDMGIRGTPS